MYRGSEMLAVGTTSTGPEHKASLVQEGDYGLQGSRAPGRRLAARTGPLLSSCGHTCELQLPPRSLHHRYRSFHQVRPGRVRTMFASQAASQPHLSPSFYILNPLTTSGPL